MQRASTGAALDLDRLDSGNPESSPPPQFSPLPVVAETPAVAAAGGVDHAADIRSTLTLWRSLFQALADESIFLCVVPSVRFPLAHDVPGLTRLLLNAKAASAANAERRAAAAPPPSKRLEAKPGVFVADSSGNVAAPAPQAEPAPPKSEIISDLKPPPFRVEQDPPPSRSASAKQAKKTPLPGAPYMPGHAEFLSARETDERDDELAKRQETARADPARYPGRQIPMNELPPDPRGPIEVINFTRVPGGRGIRRV
jgi:hypothetical protein